MPSIAISRKRMNPMSRRLSPHASSRTASEVGSLHLLDRSSRRVVGVLRVVAAAEELVVRPDGPRSAGEVQLVLGHPHEDPLAHDLPVAVGEDGVLGLPDVEDGERVDRDVGEEPQRVGPLHGELHERRPVADVARLLPGQALVDPVRVLEGLEVRAEADVAVGRRIERDRRDGVQADVSSRKLVVQAYVEEESAVNERHGAGHEGRPDARGADRERGRAAAAAGRRAGGDRGAARTSRRSCTEAFLDARLLRPLRAAALRRPRARRRHVRPDREGDRTRLRLDRVVPRAVDEPRAAGRLLVAGLRAGRDLRRRRLPLRIGRRAGRHGDGRSTAAGGSTGRSRSRRARRTPRSTSGRSLRRNPTGRRSCSRSSRRAASGRCSTTGAT